MITLKFPTQPSFKIEENVLVDNIPEYYNGFKNFGENKNELSIMFDEHYQYFKYLNGEVKRSLEMFEAAHYYGDNYKKCSKMCEKLDIINPYLLENNDIDIFNKQLLSGSGQLDTTIEYKSEKVFNKTVTKFLSNFNEKMKEYNIRGVVCGGSVSGTLFDKEYDDYDIFLIGDCDSNINNFQSYLIKYINHIQNGAGIITTDNAITFMYYHPDIMKLEKIQIVKGFHKSISHILDTFDLDCCCFAYDNGKYYTVPRGLRIVETSTNIILYIGPNTFKRMCKYKSRGWDMKIPGLEINTEKLLMGWRKYYKNRIRLDSENIGAHIMYRMKDIQLQNFLNTYIPIINGEEPKEVIGHKMSEIREWNNGYYNIYEEEFNNGFEFKKSYLSLLSNKHLQLYTLHDKFGEAIFKFELDEYDYFINTDQLGNITKRVIRTDNLIPETILRLLSVSDLDHKNIVFKFPKDINEEMLPNFDLKPRLNIIAKLVFWKYYDNYLLKFMIINNLENQSMASC